MASKAIMNTSKQGQRTAQAAAAWAYSPRNWKSAADIYGAYKTPSIYKLRAFERCKELCAKMRGRDLIISAAGCQTFSVVFRFTDSTNGKEAVAYITRDYDRFAYADGSLYDPRKKAIVAA